MIYGGTRLIFTQKRRLSFESIGPSHPQQELSTLFGSYSGLNICLQQVPQKLTVWHVSERAKVRLTQKKIYKINFKQDYTNSYSNQSCQRQPFSSLKDRQESAKHQWLTKTA